MARAEDVKNCAKMSDVIYGLPLQFIRFVLKLCLTERRCCWGQCAISITLLVRSRNFCPEFGGRSNRNVDQSGIIVTSYPDLSGNEKNCEKYILTKWRFCSRHGCHCLTKVVLYVIIMITFIIINGYRSVFLSSRQSFNVIRPLNTLKYPLKDYPVSDMYV